MKSIVLGMTLLTASASVLAQSPAESARPDPRDPRAAVPQLAYQTPFSGYVPFAAQNPGSWRELNDRVGRIGGWKVYARESQESTASPQSAADGPSPGATKIPVPGRPGSR